MMKRGVVLVQWARALSVILEKISGCTLITKVRLILLMEADFNAANKVVLGQHMLNHARHHDLIPDEIYSKKKACRRQDSDQGSLL